MVKKSEIQWKLPDNVLNMDERSVLDYLTKTDAACGIERTNMAITSACFATRPLHGHSSASKALRVLNVMGLIERVRRFGVVYWRRIRIGEAPLQKSGEWVDMHANDQAIFRSWRVCTIFQVLCVRHPNPLGVKHLTASLGDTQTHQTIEILSGMVKTGYIQSNERKDNRLVYWPTPKGLKHWRRTRKIRSDEELAMEHLSKYQDNPEMCRAMHIAFNALKMPRESHNLTIAGRVGHALRNPLKKGLVVKEHHPYEPWVWFKIKCTTSNTKENSDV